MMASTLSKSGQQLINKFSLMSSTQCVNLSIVKIKLDGKQVNIDDLPQKPKSLNLFQKYCTELGVSPDELKSKRAELKKTFMENKNSYLDKNKKLIQIHNQELKEYRQWYAKQIKLKDVDSLIKFYKKVNAKEKDKKPRKLSLFNVFVKQQFQNGKATNIQDMKRLGEQYRNLSASQLDELRKYDDKRID